MGILDCGLMWQYRVHVGVDVPPTPGVFRVILGVSPKWLRGFPLSLYGGNWTLCVTDPTLKLMFRFQI